jgi:molecular chaperone GrpE
VTDEPVHGAASPPENPEAAEEAVGPVIRDKRRLDPETGAVRGAGSGQPAAGASPSGDGSTRAADTADSQGSQAGSGASEAPANPDATLADDLKRDLQRLNAEYVNYKRRVDRDRELHKDLAVSGVVEALLPVLDDINLARQHGDLEGGPFAAIAEKFETTLGRYGVVRYGEPGEAFDPNVHEGLMHTEAELAPGTEVTTIVQVMQPGYKMGERVIRPARVAVADPQ